MIDSASRGLLTRLQTLEGVLQQHGIPVPASTSSGDQPPETSAGQSMDMTGKHTSPSDKHPPHTQPSQSPDLVPKSAAIISLEQLTGGNLSDLADAVASSIKCSDQPHRSVSIQDQGPSMPQHDDIHVRFDSSTPPAQNLHIHNATLQHIPSPQDQPDSRSYGTLVLSYGGRSKYLGPTAASEWLKDVRYQYFFQDLFSRDRT